MDRDKLQKELDYDPISQAEEIMGKSYKDDDNVTGLGLALSMSNSSRKNKMLEEAGDTFLCNELDRYLEVIEKEGFKLGFSRDYPDGTKFMVFHCGGFVLSFDTWNKNNSVNASKLYYNWVPNDKVLKGYSRSSYTSSGCLKEIEEQMVWVGDHDGREALLHNMAKLREGGTILDKWVKRPFLWFLHYSESKVEGYDYKAINEEKISCFTDELKAIIECP